MQRWLAAKIELGKKHGTTKSGANRPLGGVMDDRLIGYVDPTFKPVSKHKAQMPRQKTDRPLAWGKGRAARRLASGTTKPVEVTFIATSRTVI